MEGSGRDSAWAEEGREGWEEGGKCGVGGGREVYDGEGNELRRRAKKEGKAYETAEE